MGATFGVNLQVFPFPMLDIQSFEISISPNEHGKAHIRGTIDENMEEKYLLLAQSDLPVNIEQVDEKGNICTLFVGILHNMNIYNINGEKTLELELMTSTKQMDLVEHTRTYQNPSLTYNDLLSSLGYYSGYSFTMRSGEGSTIGDMIVQFKETDWTFIKRLASHFNTCVIPNYLSAGASFFFGLPVKSSSATMNPDYYTVKKDLDEYLSKSRNQVSGFHESDALCYIVRDRAVYRMGEKVCFMNQNMYVYEIHSLLEGQLLQNYYTLKTEAGFKKQKTWNFKIVGASLAGVITNVAKDMVQIQIVRDNDGYSTGTKWFSYSTVYSSPDGTGWYAMPEVGDEVRLYFPSEKEEEGYAISAVNVDTPDIGSSIEPSAPGMLPFSPPRTDPNVKTMINKELKEVSLYPDKIVMTNNEDMMIVIDDAEGITIQSAKEITFKSDESITLASATADLNLIGSKIVSVDVNGTKIILDKDILFEGATVMIQ